ncbi:hypothetical protein [Streptomyces xiamenensis]|uniref:hypothetical protein n=1 Tax=Streptomyces xiamenensis TaxID=408015 RepID=UPI0035DB36EF
MTADRGMPAVAILLWTVLAGMVLLAAGATGLLIHSERANDRREKEAFEATAELAERYIAEVARLAAADGFPRETADLDGVAVPDTLVLHFTRDGDRAVLVLMVSGSYEMAVNPFAGTVKRCFRTVFTGLDEAAADGSVRVETQSHGVGPCPASWLSPPSDERLLPVAVPDGDDHGEVTEQSSLSDS